MKKIQKQKRKGIKIRTNVNAGSGDGSDPGRLASNHNAKLAKR